MKTKISKFGIEIEGEFGEKILNQLSAYGEIKTDGSVHHCRKLTKKHKNCYELSTMEFASKPIKSLQAVKKIFELLEIAKNENKYHWNKSAGFHIHVSFKPKIPVEIISSQFNFFFHQELEKKFKTIIRIRGENEYCRIGFADDSEIAFTNDRYKSINFMPSFKKHGTIEFRIFPSATPKTMYQYLKFTLSTIKKFLKKELKTEFSEELEDYSEIDYSFDEISSEKKEVVYNL